MRVSILEPLLQFAMPTPRQFRTLLMALPLICSALTAQTLASRLNKPPAGVEESLRERITKFFALQSEGKFRQGEAFVCDNSKDAYYDSYKNRWTSVEIVSFTWEDSFKTGKVLMSLGTELKTLGASIPAKYPMTTIWKVENNNWCYFVPPVDTTEMASPFGAMKPGPSSKEGDPATNRDAPPTSSSLSKAVSISKPELHVLSYEESSDSLEITNGLPGSLRVAINAPDMPGLNWSLSKTELKQHEKSVLTVVYKPVDTSRKAPLNLNVVIEPFGRFIAVPVMFSALPAEPSSGPPLPKK